MRTVLVTGLFLVINLICFGQSLTDLQKKKQDAAKEIEYTTRLLNQTQKSEKSSLNQLRLINSKISRRNTIISSISKEISIYKEVIDNNALAIKMLKNDVEQLKKEYAELIRSAYKNININDKVLFLLSAENFNQAYRRYLYMKRYTAFRERQTETLNALQLVLNTNISRYERQKNIKQTLADENRNENQKLVKEKGGKNTELQKLQKQKRGLQQKLRQQRKIEQQLEREIQRIIEEEARKSREAGGSGFALTPEQKLTGNNFEQNKSRLPWPVERGIITEHFGVHRHPVLRNVQVRNNGVNIATETGAKVRAIFNGEVSRVFGISGGNTAVILRHGMYLTVYSNLREVVVKKGDKVATKQNIGTVFTDSDDGNKSVLKFQIWVENQKLNPEEWIGRQY
ncbi:MAG: peptidoglycan DD-metalloendopeptidase family protein [Bacteroidota bacterium]